MMMSAVLPDRDAAFSQLAEIPGRRGDARSASSSGHELVLPEAAFDAGRMSVIARALENFEQDKITNQKRLLAGKGFQLGCRRRSLAAQNARSRRSCRPESRPARQPSTPHLVQIAVPTQSFELGQGLGLPPETNQQAQALLHRGALGRETRGLHRLGQQLVIDFNIVRIGVSLESMCIHRIIYTHTGHDSIATPRPPVWVFVRRAHLASKASRSACMKQSA